MPLTARTADGRVVAADSYRAEIALFCRDCGDPMHYRRLLLEPYRCAHFAHNPRDVTAGPRACSGETTPEHDNAKMTIIATAPEVFDALAGALGKLEQDIEIPGDPPARRRADVLFTGADGRYPVAFEAQFSKISFPSNGTGRSVAERTADYHAAGVHVVWCFPDKRTAQEHIDAARRVYGCVGVLSPDGTEVEFHGVNALWLNKHPARALRERQEWRDKRETERLQRLAAGAYVPRPAAPAFAAPARSPSVTDEVLDRYFAQAEPVTAQQRAHLNSLDQRVADLGGRPAYTAEERARFAARDLLPLKLPVHLLECAQVYDRLGHLGLGNFLAHRKLTQHYGAIMRVVARWFPETLPTPDRPYARAYYESLEEVD